MSPLLSRDEARAYDLDSVERLGVSGALLMENAGAGAAAAILRAYPEAHRFAVIGGTGQNGGDAWVVARHLVCAGKEVVAYLIGDRASVAGDAAPNLATLEAMMLVHRGVEGLCDADVVVEGVFGTGLSRDVEGEHARVIAMLERVDADIVALDLPSGVDANTGEVHGVAVRADRTITFGAPKRGLHHFPGASLAGCIETVSLGVPPPAAEAALLGRGDLAGAIAPRAPDAHKGDAGHIAVIGGSPGTSGAALLAARGALRAGAGRVSIFSTADLDARVMECMAHPLDALDAHWESMSSCVLGPGLAVGDETRDLLLRCPCPAVLDAGALRSVSLKEMSQQPARFVLTPHPGEASHLLGTDTGSVQRDRFAAARELAVRSGQVVVLKGARTIVSDGESFIVCPFGTPALGVAGTGDVLAGIIGALLPSHAPLQAAWLGVGLHALAGERAAQADRGMLASEVADALPRTFASLGPNG